MDKVIGGTPKTQPSLCLSCEHSHVIKSPNLEQNVYCMFSSRWAVPFTIIECNIYDEKGKPTKYEMEKIAWVVETRTRGPKGFTPPLEENEVVISPPKKKDEEF